MGPFFEAFEVVDFGFDFRDESRAHILGFALHPVGVAELVERSDLSLGVTVLDPEGSWSHGTHGLELSFELFDLALESDDFA